MTHEYDTFIAIVQRLGGGLSFEDAERATQATLTTLAERLSSGQARQLARYLPEELRPLLGATADAEGFKADEFVRRVAEREGVDDLSAAERHAHAVLDALQRLAPERELADMESELSKDYLPLTAPITHGGEPAAGPEPLPAEEFVRRVADRAATDSRTARRATEAVLETLGERIAGGEVRDLAAELPPELRAALERGDAESHGAARKMPFDEFVRRVAEREGIDLERAAEHVRAVLVMLREAVTADEFSDLMAQLPQEFIAATV